MSTFHHCCTHTTHDTTNCDHNTSDTLVLTNTFQVLQEINTDMQNLTHENANVECSTPCDTVSGQPKILHNDQVSLTKKWEKVCQAQ